MISAEASLGYTSYGRQFPFGGPCKFQDCHLVPDPAPAHVAGAPISQA